MSVINDPVIRKVLVRDYILHSKEYSWASDILVSEMGLSRGSSRIDLAVINGSLHGYEIKSDVDTLTRLPSQIEMYEKFFSYLTIVTTKKHLDSIKKNFPSWLGIVLVSEIDGRILLKKLRAPKKNKRVQSSYVVQLLWKNEAIEVLGKAGIVKGLRGKSNEVLWNKICSALKLNQITAQIKLAIKARQDWQVIQPQL